MTNLPSWRFEASGRTGEFLRLDVRLLEEVASSSGASIGYFMVLALSPNRFMCRDLKVEEVSGQVPRVFELPAR